MRAFDGVGSFKPENRLPCAFFLPLFEFTSEAIGIVQRIEALVCSHTVDTHARTCVRACVRAWCTGRDTSSRMRSQLHRQSRTQVRIYH